MGFRFSIKTGSWFVLFIVLSVYLHVCQITVELINKNIKLFLEVLLHLLHIVKCCLGLLQRLRGKTGSANPWWNAELDSFQLRWLMHQVPNTMQLLWWGDVLCARHFSLAFFLTLLGPGFSLRGKATWKQTHKCITVGLSITAWIWSPSFGNILMLWLTMCGQQLVW